MALRLISGLYAHIYGLMRLEDYATVALVMYFTRRIDWCGGRQQESEA